MSYGDAGMLNLSTKLQTTRCVNSINEQLT